MDRVDYTTSRKGRIRLIATSLHGIRIRKYMMEYLNRERYTPAW